jgi:hypothetical protein
VACPPAEPLPPDQAAEIINDIAGNLIPPWFPTDATLTARVSAADTDAGVLYVSTRPFDVRVSAPAPLEVILTIDPGACMTLQGHRGGGVSSTVEHVTVTVRVGDQVTDAWTLGKTRLETPRGLLALYVPGGVIAFDRQYGTGQETFRSLVEVPALHGWMAKLPDVVARLGPSAPGAAQAALRAERGGAGDAALAGARLVAGPGAGGAHVWVDGLDLGALDGPVMAPVGGVVRVRWESDTISGGVEAGLGPGVTLELAGDGTARIVDAPAGRACARNTGEEDLLVCGRPWGTRSAFDLATHTCSPDGRLSVAGVVGMHRRTDLTRTRTLYTAMPGEYSFSADPEGLNVTLNPQDGATCTPRGVSAPGWLYDIEGRALYSVAEERQTLLGAAPMLLPLADQYLVDAGTVLVLEKALTLVTPDLGLRVGIGRDGTLSQYQLEWSGEVPASARLRGRMVIPNAQGLTLWPGELAVDGDTVTISGAPWLPGGRLCDGTQISSSSAFGSWMSRFHTLGWLESAAPKGPRPGPGLHTVRAVGIDRDARSIWFEVQPAHRWPTSVMGLPDVDWMLDLEGHNAVVRCLIP